MFCNILVLRKLTVDFNKQRLHFFRTRKEIMAGFFENATLIMGLVGLGSKYEGLLRYRKRRNGRPVDETEHVVNRLRGQSLDADGALRRHQ